jgi:hypothetical protein
LELRIKLFGACSLSKRRNMDPIPQSIQAPSPAEKISYTFQVKIKRRLRLLWIMVYPNLSQSIYLLYHVQSYLRYPPRKDGDDFPMKNHRHRGLGLSDRGLPESKIHHFYGWDFNHPQFMAGFTTLNHDSSLIIHHYFLWSLLNHY